MFVSQFWINAIPVIGVVVGCLGGFCLAQGLLGKSGNLLLRALVVALMVGILGAVQVLTNPLKPVFTYGLPLELATGKPGAIISGTGAFVVGFLGYLGLSKLLAAVPSEFREEILEEMPQSRLGKLKIVANMGGVAIGCLGLLLAGEVAVGVIFLHDSIGPTIEYEAILGTLIVLMAVIFGWSLTMSPRHLQLFGLLLTIVGGLAQGFPNLVSLLNIPVK